MSGVYFPKHKVILFVVTVFALLIFAVGIRLVAKTPDLFISEYIEGTSNNKAIEIYNPTQDAINLSDYKIESFINGSRTVSTYATTSATIVPNQVFVICNSNASAEILNVCNLKISGVGTVMSFNGDDTLVLAKTDGTIVDMIGQIGVDPGAEWGSGLTSTADNTLRRKCPVLNGNVDVSSSFDPEIEWDGYATDTFLGLGSHATCLMTATSSGEPTIIPTLNPTDLPTSIPTTTSMPTIVPSPTDAPVPSFTPSFTVLPTPTNLPVPTESPSATPTPSDLPTLTNSPSPTLIPIPTDRPMFTFLPTFSPGPTVIPSFHFKNFGRWISYIARFYRHLIQQFVHIYHK